MQLTIEQEKKAIELFVQGFSRPEVASILIEEDFQDLPDDTDERALRKKLRDRLRTCDPSSSQFARKKHGDYFDLHRKHINRILEYHYKSMLARSLKNFEKQIEALEKQIEALRSSIDQATETHPVGASEYIAAHNLLMNMRKRKHDLEEQMLIRLERMYIKTAPF